MTIAPGTLNLTLYIGGTFSYTLTWTDQNSNPINLTGYTAEMQIRSNLDDASPIFDLTTTSGITLGGTAGTVTFTINATQTALLSPGSALYDLKLTAASGDAEFLLQGTITIEQMVTR